MRAFLIEKEKREGGFGKNSPFFFLPFSPSTEQRRGMKGGRPWDPALWSTAAAGKKGKRESRPRGSDSPTHLERRRSVKGCPRRWADVGDSSYGGGAARLGRGRVVGMAVVVALFIGRERRWRGGAPVAELGGH